MLNYEIVNGKYVFYIYCVKINNPFHDCVYILFSQVLITVYWLGRRAQLEPFYCGPQLNFKAFEGLLGLTLSKV